MLAWWNSCCAAVGNTSEALHFHTLSGVLTVKRIQATPGPGGSASSGSSSQGSSLLMEMSLPLADPVDAVPPCAADVAGPLVRACVGDMPVG